MHPFDLGAVALARAIRAGATTSTAAVEACLARIDARDGALGAFVEVHRAAALSAARSKDKRPSEAPFHGVPIAIKDLNLVRFRTTRFGGAAMPTLWSPMDDVTVSGLRRAGFVIVGMTATSEMGVVPLTEPVGRAPTRNPWALERTPGGSSGGAGVAVAAGMVPVAHGADGGGSIRIPASLCGLVGLKASRGRIPNNFGIKDPNLIHTCGALTQNVEDSVAMLQVQGGSGAPAAEGALRVRLVLDVPLVATDPEVRAAVERAADVLRDRGHHVELGVAPAGSIDDFLPIWQRMFAEIPILRTARAEPVTRWLAEAGRRYDPAFVRARQAELAARWGSWLEGCDVLLTPTVAVPPPKIGAFDREDGEAYFRACAVLGAWTAPFNVTGQPALTVPVGLHSLGTPIGAQLAGHHGSDSTLLRLAGELEEAGLFNAKLTTP